MESGLSPVTLALFAAALAAGGAVSGFLAGLLGIGGGALVIIILYQLLEAFGVDEAVRMHISIGTALAVIVPTSIRSFLGHRAHGAVDMEVLRRWALPVILGVTLGAVLAGLASARQFKAVFVVLAFLFAARMFLGRPHWRLGEEMPGAGAMSAYGVGIGFFSVMMGIGGGVLGTTVMTLYGRSIHQAVATASGLGVLISIPGVIGFVLAGWGDPNLPPLSFGYVSLIAFALVTPISVMTAPFGVRVAHRLTKRSLEVVFGVFLVVIGARFLIDVI